MLNERTWKRIAAGLSAIALAAVNTGASLNGTGIVAYAAQRAVIAADGVQEDVVGGWEFSDISAGVVTESEQAALNAALEGLVGVTYEAKDVIASQVVAGRNLAFLCKATPVVPDARSYWAIVSVYVDLEGKATLNNIAAVDPAEMKVKENVDEPADGAWESAAKEQSAILPENVQKAFSGVLGVSYAPIAVLGTQLVAGKNYCILAYGTTVTANPMTNLYAVYVYEKLDGTAEVTAISALDLAAYVSPAETEELIDLAECTVTTDAETGAVLVMNGENEIADTEYTVVYEGINNDYKGEETPTASGKYAVIITANEDSAVVTGTARTEFTLEPKAIMVGGWEFSDISAGVVTESEQAALNAALEGLVGVTYEAKDVIASQVVAGRNLAFLCKVTPATLEAKSYWAIVSVYVDLEGKATLNNIAAVDPAEMKVKENADEPADGAWESTAKEQSAILPENVQKAFSGVLGVSYAPIAVLGTQLVAGKNYCILAYGTTVTANPMTNLYAVYVYEKLDGTAEVTAISALDLAAYVTPAETEELIDLAECTVTADAETGAVLVMNGENEIADTEYTVVYEGIDNDYKGEETPTASGKYAVIITANEESAVVTGTARTEFTLEPKAIMVGGWEFSDISAGVVTETEQAALNAALEGLVGVTYEAKDVIASQVVAGRNLAFLCKATPATLEAKSYWAIVSVYVDLEGKATLNNIAAVDPAEMKVKENVDEPADGAWESAAKKQSAILPENVQKAFSGILGVSYAPIAVLGTQLVAGKNYCILAYGTTVTANPMTNLYAVYVYEKLDGTAEVTAISALDLAAYVTPETITIAGDLNGDGYVNQKDVTILRRYIAGGWDIVIDESAADFNGDGAVNLKDVTLLRRKIAGGWDVAF